MSRPTPVTTRIMTADSGSSRNPASALNSATLPPKAWNVILPELKPALWTGFALAFARALGEYGSVVFISGNIQYKTEIMPLLIMGKLDQFEYAPATAIAVVMLLVSFLVLLFINLINWRTHRRMLAR